MLPISLACGRRSWPGCARPTELQRLAAELDVGRAAMLGSVPLDPVLQWREQLITDSDVWARHVANQATIDAFESIAKSIVDKQAWERL